MVTRDKSKQLLEKYIENDALRHHCYMVALAMEAYANELGHTEDIVEEWWAAGLLHDLDWEMYPDEHPNKAVNEILPEYGYSEDILNAIKAHAPDRTGYTPTNQIDKYLFACDELSGFMHAAAIIRPNGFEDMKVKSITKKLKDKNFAASVSREDINKGVELIESNLQDHIQFLINVFNN